jgi:hypothetical protein
MAYHASLLTEDESVRQRLNVCPREVIAFEQQGLLTMARAFLGALVAKEVELDRSAKALQLTRDFLDCREVARIQMPELLAEAADIACTQLEDQRDRRGANSNALSR